MSRSVQRWVQVSISVRRCLEVFGVVQIFPDVFGGVLFRCLEVSIGVCRCLEVFRGFQMYAYVFGGVHLGV